MKSKRTFASEFKRQAVEELLSGVSTRAQISRKYNLSAGLISHWKEQYEKGKLNNEPTQEAALKERIKELECMIGRLAMDNDFLKKALQASIEATRKKESLLPDVYPRQEAQSKGGAKMIDLALSAYYYKPKEQPMPQIKEDNDLRDRIEQIALEFPRYGYRRITHQLKRERILVNHKRVLRIMRESSLLVVTKKKWVRTTDSNHRYPVYSNLTKDLALIGINQVWIADITYIRILLGFVYLAVILDAFSRKVLGYCISKSLDAELALEALRMAIQRRLPLKDVIHHPDQGVQYASHDYTEELIKHGFKISMSRKGNPFDNAKAESFIKTLKQEEVYLWEYSTYEDVQKRVPFFLDAVYNQKRLHSSLGYMPPDEFEAKLFQEKLLLGAV